MKDENEVVSNEKERNVQDGKYTDQEKEDFSTYEFELITYNIDENNAVDNSFRTKKVGETMLKKTFQCSICSQEFAKKKELNIHQSSAHPDFIAKSFTCSICDKAFSHVCIDITICSIFD